MMNQLLKKWPVLICCLLLAKTHAQDNHTQNLYFTKKNKPVAFGKEDYKPRQGNSFYLYRNCIYDLELKNKLRLSARVTDMRNDSMYYTGAVNPDATIVSADETDTFSLHPAQIRKLRLIGDRMMGLYSSMRLRQYRYEWEASAEPKKFMTSLRTVYAPDSSSSTTYELVPFLTAQGLDQVYKECGKSYYYEGSITPQCPDTVKETKYIRKNWVWFTPSNANEIRGINFSLQTGMADDRSLLISGVNIGADLLSMYAGMMLLFTIASGNPLINLPDTVETARMTRVHGLSLSFGGLAVDEMKGVSVNGFVYMVTETKGLVISAFQNIAADFTGMLISPLRNKSIKGKGIQISLWNTCKHLKGVQIGLWNVNSKRKLPFINWDF